MTDAQRPDSLFAAATAPARVVSRVRPDLAASLDRDSATLNGARRGTFLVLTVIAVAYPIIASVIHAFLGPQPEADLFTYAITPFYTIVYAESLPFMIAVVGVGAFSPALGVLLIAIFIPADLVATAVAFPGGNQFQPPLSALAARLLSYAILWILAVEIPLRASRMGAGWQASRTGTSPIAVAAVHAAAVAVLVFLWSSAAVWLIQPVITWTNMGGAGALLPLRMTAATWNFPWILVLGAAAIAFAAGRIQRPSGGVAAVATPVIEPQPPGPARELIRVAVFALLLSGMMSDWLQAGLIVVGLIVAGPVLSRVLPRLPVPAWMARMRPVTRWVVALMTVALLTGLVLAAIPAGQVPDYLLLAILLAVVMPLARVMVHAGAGREPPSGAVSTISPILGALLRLVVVLAIWLAIPAVALANDGNETGTPWMYPVAAVGLAAAAALASAANADPSNPQPIKRPPPAPPFKPHAPPGGKAPGPWQDPKDAPPPVPQKPFKWWNPWTWRY